MKKAFKLFITVLLVISLLCVISGCGETNDPTPTATVEPENTPEATSTPEATVAPEKTPAPTKEVEELRPTTIAAPSFEVPEVGENGLINLLPLFSDHCARVVDIVIPGHTEKAYSFFDGKADSLMRIPSVTSADVIFISDVPVRIDYVSFTSGDNASELPVKFTFYGCKRNDYKDKVVLYSTDSLVVPTENFTESEVFKTEDQGYYQAFMLSIESVNGGSNIALGKINMYADPAVSESCIGEYEKFNSDISNYRVLNSQLKPRLCVMDPTREGAVPKNVFDCDSETYEYMTTQWAREYEYISFIFMADSEITLDAYRFTSAWRDGAPKSWKLYGSTTKKYEPEDLVLLDERTNEAMPLWPFGESDVYTIENPTPFRYYIIYITESSMIGNDENWLSIALSEMTLLQKK